MQQTDVPLLLLCGAPGTGKSSVGWEVYWRLMREGVPVAHVDLDGIGFGPPGHSASFDLKFKNVAAVWRTYSDIGASAFVVSGLRAQQKDIDACCAAVPGAAPTVVVLTVAPEEQRTRLVARANTQFGLARGGGSSTQTPDSLERFVAAAQRQLEDEAEDISSSLVLDSEGVPVVELAQRLLLETGWPRFTGRS